MRLVENLELETSPEIEKLYREFGREIETVIIQRQRTIGPPPESVPPPPRAPRALPAMSSPRYNELVDEHGLIRASALGVSEERLDPNRPGAVVFTENQRRVFTPEAPAVDAEWEEVE